MLVNPATGEVREAKVVTAVDDHSRYCVSAKVVEHATSRAVCLAFAEALVRFGVPWTCSASSDPSHRRHMMSPKPAPMITTGRSLVYRTDLCDRHGWHQGS